MHEKLHKHIDYCANSNSHINGAILIIINYVHVNVCTQEHMSSLEYRTGRKFRGVFNFAFFVGG